jgi:hypothetical protein
LAQPPSPPWAVGGRSERAYDGRFTFTRLRWESGRSSAWNHDFPRAEQNLTTLLRELTLIDADATGSLTLALDDPQLFRYPIAYMWEPGFWSMTDLQALRFREYLQKGGFAIFDDFEFEQWNNFIDFPHPMYGISPTYVGIHEDNDPRKRLMVIANHNNDVAEYWEWSGSGVLPVDASNEAYKLGINYMLYGLTH